MYNSKSLFIFPTQLIVAKSEKFLSYKDQILESCYESRLLNPDKRNRSNRLGWQSKFGDYYKDPAFKPLFDDFNEILTYCLKNEFRCREGVGYKFNGAFLQISPPKAFNYSHIHPKPYFTCVFYIKTPENSGNISFGCPDTYIINNLVGNRDPEDVIEKNLQSKFEVKPEEGMVLIFPSTLRHQVEPNLSQEDRISMGIDISLINPNYQQNYEYE